MKRKPTGGLDPAHGPEHALSGLETQGTRSDKITVAPFPVPTERTSFSLLMRHGETGYRFYFISRSGGLRA